MAEQANRRPSRRPDNAGAVEAPKSQSLTRSFCIGKEDSIELGPSDAGANTAAQGHGAQYADRQLINGNSAIERNP